MPHPVPPPPGANPQQQQQQPNDYIYRGLQRVLQNLGGGQAMNDPFAQGSNIQGLLSSFLRTMQGGNMQGQGGNRALGQGGGQGLGQGKVEGGRHLGRALGIDGIGPSFGKQIDSLGRAFGIGGSDFGGTKGGQRPGPGMNRGGGAVGGGGGRPNAGMNRGY